MRVRFIGSGFMNMPEYKEGPVTRKPQTAI
jgi:hypothetical protein